MIKITDRRTRGQIDVSAWSEVLYDPGCCFSELALYKIRYKILYFPNQGSWRAWYTIINLPVRVVLVRRRHHHHFIKTTQFWLWHSSCSWKVAHLVLNNIVSKIAVMIFNSSHKGETIGLNKCFHFQRRFANSPWVLCWNPRVCSVMVIISVLVSSATNRGSDWSDMSIRGEKIQL